MASPLDINHGQMLEFERTLIAAGLDSDDVFAILRSPAVARQWVEQLHAILAPKPDIFSSLAAQLKTAQVAYGQRFTKGEYNIVRAQMVGLSEPTNPLQAWVLYGTLRTLEETFDFLLEKTTRAHPDTLRSKELRSDPELMRVLPGNIFSPYALSWVLVDFGAHLGKAPSVVRGSDSAGIELLAAAWLHPHWAQSLGKKVGGIFVPNVNLCGLEVRRSVDRVWLDVPYLQCCGVRVDLSTDRIVDPHSYWACPVLVAGSN